MSEVHSAPPELSSFVGRAAELDAALTPETQVVLGMALRAAGEDGVDAVLERADAAAEHLRMPRAHLGHVYAKLGIANRTELARIAGQRPKATHAT